MCKLESTQFNNVYLVVLCLPDSYSNWNLKQPRPQGTFPWLWRLCVRRGENRSTRRKTWEQKRKPITDLIDPYMASTPEFEPGSHCQLEVSALTTLTTHTPPIKWRWI